jgi:uncharacterized protein YggE
MCKMKKMVISMVFGLAMGFMAFPAHADETESRPQGFISVNGTGSVTANPDMATLHLGVETRGENTEQAVAENNAQVENIIAALRAQGIAEADIRTVNFYIHPQWEQIDHSRWDDSAFQVVGYTVNNTLSVTVRNVDRVGAIFSAAIEAGSNIGGGIQFGLQDSTHLYNQALALAMEDADSSALVIAQAIGRPLTGITSVHESSGHFMPMAWSQMDFGMMLRSVESMGMGILPVQVGELTITAHLNVMYSFDQ